MAAMAYGSVVVRFVGVTTTPEVTTRLFDVSLSSVRIFGNKKCPMSFLCVLFHIGVLVSVLCTGCAGPRQNSSFDSFSIHRMARFWSSAYGRFVRIFCVNVLIRACARALSQQAVLHFFVWHQTLTPPTQSRRLGRSLCIAGCKRARFYSFLFFLKKEKNQVPELAERAHSSLFTLFLKNMCTKENHKTRSQQDTNEPSTRVSRF